MLAYFAGDRAATVAAFEEVLAYDPSVTSAHLFAGVAASTLDDGRRAAAHLEAVVASPAGLPDRLQAKYLPGRTFALSLAVRITEAVTARPPLSELAAALMLAELYQEQCGSRRRSEWSTRSTRRCRARSSGHIRAAAQVALDRRAGALDSFKAALARPRAAIRACSSRSLRPGARAGAVRPARQVPRRPRADLRGGPRIRGRGRPSGRAEGHGVKPVECR